MSKRLIQNGDVVFSTGVFLQRDTSVNGGWIVTEFEDDTFFEGLVVNSNQTSDCTVEYYTGDDEEGEN